MDERVYVDCVEGLTEVQGHNYSSILWLRFVKALCDLVCEFVYSCGGGVVCLKTMLVRIVWDVCGDVRKNDFFPRFWRWVRAVKLVCMRFLDQGLCLVWDWDDFCKFPDLRDDVLIQGEIENFCEV